MIGAASATGQTSLIRVLFELEQIIGYHKFLNLEMPVVFKEFIEALSSFQFLDLTNFIPQSIMHNIKSISGSEMDAKGPIKAVYYQGTINFYKNIISVLLSLFIMIAINLLVFLIARSLPFQAAQRFSRKMKIRFNITVSDLA